MNRVVENFLRIAMEAMNKEELPQEEKFAICYFAGVPTRIECFDPQDVQFSMRLTTAVPCDVVKIHGKWQVFQAAFQTETPLPEVFKLEAHHLQDPEIFIPRQPKGYFDPREDRRKFKRKK